MSTTMVSVSGLDQLGQHTGSAIFDSKIERGNEFCKYCIDMIQPRQYFNQVGAGVCELLGQYDREEYCQGLSHQMNSLWTRVCKSYI